MQHVLISVGLVPRPVHAFPDVDVAPSAQCLEQGRFASAVLAGENGYRRRKVNGSGMPYDRQIKWIGIGCRESILGNAQAFQVHEWAPVVC
jgi:hypothetical protein